MFDSVEEGYRRYLSDLEALTNRQARLGQPGSPKVKVGRGEYLDDISILEKIAL